MQLKGWVIPNTQGVFIVSSSKPKRSDGFATVSVAHRAREAGDLVHPEPGAPYLGARLALTTDSYVVKPRFFRVVISGTLAVNGTVNDLAMCGARPLYLSSAFILEEGFAMKSLRRVVESMRLCAAGAGVELVTGDTKVVDRGKGDGIFMNTAGIGVVAHG